MAGRVPMRIRISRGLEKELAATAVLSPSWPGVSRPSALQRRGADGRDTPGHDDRETTLLRQSAYPDSYGACPGHLRFDGWGWMAGTRPAMTERQWTRPSNPSPSATLS